MVIEVNRTASDSNHRIRSAFCHRDFDIVFFVWRLKTFLSVHMVWLRCIYVHCVCWHHRHDDFVQIDAIRNYVAGHVGSEPTVVNKLVLAYCLLLIRSRDI